MSLGTFGDFPAMTLLLSRGAIGPKPSRIRAARRNTGGRIPANFHGSCS
jgi:hypothetical protein